jgi:hypothetical protein
MQAQMTKTGGKPNQVDTTVLALEGRTGLPTLSMWKTIMDN